MISVAFLHNICFDNGVQKLGIGQIHSMLCLVLLTVNSTFVMKWCQLTILTSTELVFMALNKLLHPIGPRFQILTKIAGKPLFLQNCLTTRNETTASMANLDFVCCFRSFLSRSTSQHIWELILFCCSSFIFTRTICFLVPF